MAATRTHPAKKHRWQSIAIAGQPAVVALPCPNCDPDVVLRCLGPGRGLMRLELPGARVANGRASATKQIRIVVDGDLLRRRATTQKTPLGYTPVLDLAFDDALLDRLSKAKLVRLNFYGQRSFVGLEGAAGPIRRLRHLCQPAPPHSVRRHCIWSVVITCSPVRSLPDEVVKSNKKAFVRKSSNGYCAVIATSDLAHARALVKSVGGRLERSCL